MKRTAVLALAVLAFTGCSRQSPIQPDATSSGATTVSATPGSAATQAKPGYEPAYYNGGVVTINAIEVAQNTNALTHATADFYEVVYPPNQSLWPSPPQCNPCDHDGNGIDFLDFHDHILDSIPSDPGHGEYTALWRVWAIVPADMSPAGQTAYAARLPMKSEQAIDAAVAAGVAQKIDTAFYFLCAVVSPNAVH